jgi:hypothetical protein
MLASAPSAWESHSYNIDPNGDRKFNSEHVELTSRALAAVDAFQFLGSPDKHPLKVCAHVKDYNSATLGWKKLRTRTFCPANFAELPDYSHSMEDYINQNRACPPLAIWTAEGKAEECHSFEHFMGALNSSHFPPQTQLNYEQYHRIAQAVLALGNDLQGKLLLADAEQQYGHFVNECKMEALTYESIGQHYLQDQWAMGHMWHRWGGPEVDDFPLPSYLGDVSEVPYPKILYGTLIGAVSGMIHGWKSTVLGLWDSPAFTDDPLSYFVPGVEWVRDDFSEPLSGVGDLFLPELHEFDQQRLEMDDCTREGFRQVKGFDPIGSSISDLCWTNYATNWAMNIGLNMGPSAAAALIVTATAFSNTGEPGTDFVLQTVGREMFRLSAIYALGALMDPWDTYLAEGFTSKDRDERLTLFTIQPNDAYKRIPKYMDPAHEAPGDAPDSQGPQPPPDNDLFGVRQVRYFNQCHTELYCEKPDYLEEYRERCRNGGGDNEADCGICEDLAPRFFLGEPSICEVLAPGRLPDPDNPNHPESEQEIKTWCRQPDPVNRCDLPVEGQWGGIMNPLQGGGEPRVIECGELDMQLRTPGQICTTGEFNANTVCPIATNVAGGDFQGCADQFVPSWTQEWFQTGPANIMAEYRSFSTFAGFDTLDRLSVTLREQAASGDSIISNGSLGRCDDSVSASCWQSSFPGVCTEYASGVSSQETTCRFALEGTFLPTPCPALNVVGRCVRGAGDQAISTLYYGETDPARVCDDGTWIASP